MTNIFLALMVITSLMTIGYIGLSVKGKKDTMAMEYNFVWGFILSFAGYYAVSMVAMRKILHFSWADALFQTVTFDNITVYAGFVLVPAGIFLIASIIISMVNWKKIKNKKGMVGRKGLIHSIDSGLTNFATKHPRICFFFIYSILFWMTCYLFFSSLFMEKHSFIWTIDGMPQYVPYLQYTGEYLRQGIRSVSSGDIALKMFDFNIGMGEDITVALRTHFTELTSVFVPSRYTGLFYDVLMIARFYLVGLSFAAFSRYRKTPWLNTMVGSIIYVFSAYTLAFSVRHPIFAAPLIYLPLLLLAMERLIKDGKCLLYALLVGMSLFSNYYFLYINTFAMGIYALIRFFDIHRKERIREFILMMIRIITSYILGAAMASAIFLPTLIRTLSSERVGSGSARILTKSLWEYGDERWIRLFLSTITAKFNAGFQTNIACAAIVLPAVVALLLGNVRKRMGAKIAVLLEVLFLMVPVFGFIFAAFSNTNNRWAYVVVFTMAYVTALMVDDLRKLHPIQISGIFGVVALYYFLYTGHFATNKDLRLSFIILIMTVACILYANITKNMSRLQYGSILMLCVVTSIFVHGRYTFDDGKKPLLDEFLKKDLIEDKFRKSRFHNFAEIEDDSFYRCDTDLTWDYYENTAIVLKYNGTSMYNSVLNSAVVNYHRELNSIGISAVHRYYGLDGRTSLENLANVKYLMTEKGNTEMLPYGFVKADGLGDENYDLYKNENILSIGYTYDGYTAKSDYDELSPLEKQERQIRSAVIDTEKEDDFVEGLSEDTNQSSPEIQTVQVYDFIADDGVRIQGNKLHIEENGTGFTIKVPRKAGYETYLSFDQLRTNKVRAVVRIDCNGHRKKLVTRDDNQVYSIKRSDFLVCLGYSDTNKVDDVYVSFEVHGDYTLDKVELQYLSMANYDQVLAKRQEGSLQNVVIGKNEVKGDCTITGDKIMAFSIPYSKGWKAYVDGEETDLVRVNTMYMGIRLGQGEHKVRLAYVTPGFVLGLIVSGISCLIFLALFILHSLRMNTVRKRKKARRKAKQKSKKQ